MSRNLDVVLQELRTLSDAMQFQAEPAKFSLHGIDVEIAYCNGIALLVFWNFDGTQDVSLPKHSHQDIYEHVGILKGGIFRCHMEDRIALLQHVGDSLVIPPNTPHQVQMKMKDGPCSGWSLFVPPETLFIPKDVETRSCLLRATGRCGGNPEDCLKNNLLKWE